MVLPVLTESSTSRGPVFLVEEHDEALLLWRRSRLSGETLIHLDAHIDFEWIAAKRPLELLDEPDLASLDARLRETRGWTVGDPVNRSLHLGNYLYEAFREGIVSEWFWVVPDPLWDSREGLRILWRDLGDLYRLRTGAMTELQFEKAQIRTSFLNVPTVILPLRNLPRFDKKVLLSIDLDYLTEPGPGPVPPADLWRRRLPWIWPDELFRTLGEKGVVPREVTIARSVRSGFTPVPFKYFGRVLEILFQEGTPVTGSAALKRAIQLRHQGEFAKALEVLEGNGEGQGFLELRGHSQSVMPDGQRPIRHPGEWIPAHPLSNSRGGRNDNTDADFDTGMLEVAIGADSGTVLQERTVPFRGVKKSAESGLLAAFFYQRAQSYLELKQREKAREEYAKCLAADPDFSGPYATAGRFFEALGRPAEALREYERAQVLNPGDEEALKGEARTRTAMKDWKRAEAIYEAFLRRGSEDPEVRGDYGLLKFRQRQWEEARDLLESSLRQESSPPFSKFVPGSQGRFSLSGRGPDRKPGPVPSDENRPLQTLYELTEQCTRNSETVLQERTVPSDDRPDFSIGTLHYRIALGESHLKLGDFRRAKETLREALRQGGHYPKTYFLLAQACRALGSGTKAAEFFLEGLRLKAVLMLRIWRESLAWGIFRLRRRQ